jgi:hypothetical protein
MLEDQRCHSAAMEIVTAALYAPTIFIYKLCYNRI